MYRSTIQQREYLGGGGLYTQDMVSRNHRDVSFEHAKSGLAMLEVDHLCFLLYRLSSFDLVRLVSVLLR